MSTKLNHMEEEKSMPVSTRRWLVRELDLGRMSTQEALNRLCVYSKNPGALLWLWRRRYASEISLTLPDMTHQEREKLDAAQHRMQVLEKQLEDAQMKNVALETMIDLAEEQFKISIRKKSGPKR